MNEFLNPKSMMTPGMAGALVMFLSNAVCFQFPEIAPRWVALSLSFALGGFVVTAARLKVAPATGFWVINSLIIFAVAAGSAGVAAKAGGQSAISATSALTLFISSANAQTAAGTSPPGQNSDSSDYSSLRAQLAAAHARIAEQQRQLESLHQAATAVPATAPQGTKQAKDVKKQADRFFKEW